MTVWPVGEGIVEYRFDRLFSSSTFLKEHLAEYEPWSLIRAVDQTAGRGRFDRLWNMVAGKDLAFSILVPLDNIPLASWGNITQAAALAVAEHLDKCDINAQIKWPNDILIDGAKICGILCESMTIDDRSWAIVGIGLNVNSTVEELNVASSQVTTMLDESQNEHEIFDVMKAVALCLKKLVEELRDDGFGRMRNLYNSLLYKCESGIQTVVIGGIEVPVKVIGLSDSGRLLIDRGAGRVEEIY